MFGKFVIALCFVANIFSLALGMEMEREMESVDGFTVEELVEASRSRGLPGLACVKELSSSDITDNLVMLHEDPLGESHKVHTAFICRGGAVCPCAVW